MLEVTLAVQRTLRLKCSVNAETCPLIRWYREGADVQSNLLRLAMFIGHVSIVSTAHYLHFVPTMRELASKRFEAAFGDVVVEGTP